MTRGRIPTTEEVIQCIMEESIEIKMYYDGTAHFDFDLDGKKVKELGLNFEITEAAALDIVEKLVLEQIEIAISKIEKIKNLNDDEIEELLELTLENGEDIDQLIELILEEEDNDDDR